MGVYVEDFFFERTFCKLLHICCGIWSSFYTFLMSSWRLKVNLWKRSEGSDGACILRSGREHLFWKELPLHGFPHLLGAGLLQTLRDMHPPGNDLHEDQPPSWGTQEFHLVKSMSFLNSEQENSGVLKK